VRNVDLYWTGNRPIVKVFQTDGRIEHILFCLLGKMNVCWELCLFALP
jgi:hypothetical protein